MAREWSAMRKFPMFNARMEITNPDNTANKIFYGFCLAVWNALHNQSAKISAPTGGTTVDSEARTAINSIITALEKYGITKE